MDKKKSVIMWVSLCIAVVICFVLAMYIVNGDKNSAENANLNASKDSNTDFLDYSDYYVRTGYFLKEDGGKPFLLEKDGEDCPIKLHPMNDAMFSELMSGDFVMVASDSGMDASFPPSTGAYACVLLKKCTENTKSLPEIQEALSGEMEELGWTFEKNWRK